MGDLEVLASRLHGYRCAPSDALAVVPGQTSSTPRDDIMFVEECSGTLVDRASLRNRLRAKTPLWDFMTLASVGWDDPLDLSILFSGGEETNKDSPQ